jgi:hypothetical protein
MDSSKAKRREGSHAGKGGMLLTAPKKIKKRIFAEMSAIR